MPNVSENIANTVAAIRAIVTANEGVIAQLQSVNKTLNDTCAFIGVVTPAATAAPPTS